MFFLSWLIAGDGLLFFWKWQISPAASWPRSNESKSYPINIYQESDWQSWNWCNFNSKQQQNPGKLLETSSHVNNQM